MKHKQNIHWSRLLRRALALFLATLAAWLLLVCAGAGAAANAFKSLGESSAFVSAALAAELGEVARADSPGARWTAGGGWWWTSPRCCGARRAR